MKDGGIFPSEAETHELLLKAIQWEYVAETRTYFSIGKQDASPLPVFFQLFNELALHLRHSTVNYFTEETLAALTPQHHFGGAVVSSSH